MQNNFNAKKLIEINESLYEQYKCSEIPGIVNEEALYNCTMCPTLTIPLTIIKRRPFRKFNYATAYLIYIMFTEKKELCLHTIQRAGRWMTVMNGLEEMMIYERQKKRA